MQLDDLAGRPRKSLADGIGLSIGAAGAREQSLEALAAYEASRTGAPS